MTIKDLSQLKALKTEITNLENQLQELESRATSTTYYFTNLPKGCSVTDKTAMGGQIAELKKTITMQKITAAKEYNRIYKTIFEIDNSYLRQIIIERFIREKSWVQISVCLCGGITPSGCNKMVSRYLKKCEEQEKKKSN